MFFNTIEADTRFWIGIGSTRPVKDAVASSSAHSAQQRTYAHAAHDIAFVCGAGRGITSTSRVTKTEDHVKIGVENIAPSTPASTAPRGDDLFRPGASLGMPGSGMPTQHLVASLCWGSCVPSESQPSPMPCITRPRLVTSKYLYPSCVLGLLPWNLEMQSQCEA